VKLYLSNKSNLNLNSNVDNLYKDKNYDKTQKKKKKKKRTNIEKKKRLTLIIVGLVFGLKFLLIVFLYCIWQIKHFYFFGEKSNMQHMSSRLGNDKFLFGIYINLLNLVWRFYKF